MKPHGSRQPSIQKLTVLKYPGTPIRTEEVWSGTSFSKLYKKAPLIQMLRKLNFLPQAWNFMTLSFRCLCLTQTKNQTLILFTRDNRGCPLVKTSFNTIRFYVKLVSWVVGTEQLYWHREMTKLREIYSSSTMLDQYGYPCPRSGVPEGLSIEISLISFFSSRNAR